MIGCCAVSSNQPVRDILHSFGLWALGLGPWALGLGPWALGLGPWALGLGRFRSELVAFMCFKLFAAHCLKCGNPNYEFKLDPRIRIRLDTGIDQIVACARALVLNVKINLY